MAMQRPLRTPQGPSQYLSFSGDWGFSRFKGRGVLAEPIITLANFLVDGLAKDPTIHREIR
jgi:hypothetical protein